MLGVSAATYLLWENDRAVVSIGFWPKILSFLGYDPLPQPQTLGERLFAARRMMGLSIKRIAVRFGADEATVARWESGQSEPKGEYINRVEGLLSGCQE